MKELNEDPAVHGILVQVPLPDHMDEYAVLNTISAEKDVDGFHPLNIGTFSTSCHYSHALTPLKVLYQDVGAIAENHHKNSKI